jgi:hypothetical protein
MDVGSKAPYPANALSNFSPHKFVIDGVECNSMEGFLQSLKFQNPDMQVEVCKLVGFAAKRKGANKNWKEQQLLWWRGIGVKRNSPEYQALLDRAFTAMATQCDGFKRALKAAQGAVFTHSMGKNKEQETVLTEREFCRRLNMARELVLKMEGDNGTDTKPTG